ncbi:MAG TPA: DNA translocase FtsK, partial [Opitutaceae bacterium]|nr:DNA translocase FtsK [Opitutaceae bacterium]
MPRAESSNSKDKDTPSFGARQYRPNWLGASACAIAGILLGVALFDYEPNQSWEVTTNPTDKNLVGDFGAWYSFSTFRFLGGAAWLVPFFLAWMSVIFLRSSRHLGLTRFLTFLGCVACTSGLLAMQEALCADADVYTAGPGGALGVLLYDSFLRDNLGVFGSGLIFGMVNILGFVFILTRDIAHEFEKIMLGISDWRKRRAAARAARAEELRQRREEAAKAKTAAATAAAAAKSAMPAAAAGGAGRKIVVPKTEDPLTQAPKITRPPVEVAPEPKAAAEQKPAPARAAKAATAEPKAVPPGKIELNIVKPEETKKARVTLPQSDDKNYEFPPLALLKEQVKISTADSEEEHRQNAENLLRILGEFGVEVTLGEIHVGPVITRYEVVPAAGVRVEKISGLDKNIALGMRAQSVRILAPIPGKAAVGVEVPNQKPTPVGMREILESEDWAGARAELPIALGKDVSGKPLVSDLTKMPHLLIAGATGSGKSVCINSIVASVLYSKSPKDVRLIMVDPKVVELKIFNALPHMLIPVVTEPKKVPAALKWLLGEMEQRYQIFAKVNVRNITGFNNRKKEKPEPPSAEQQAELAGVATDDDIEVPERLPYIVAIIDELADLMMIAPAEIETSIARLAQLARAAGIHLIIATQRPSVNVITGVIKANVPARLAFAVSSLADSRVILDQQGAERL